MEFTQNNELITDVEQNCILVGLDTGQDPLFEDSMEELKNLAEAAGAKVLGSVIQRKDRPEAALFIGKGKVDEVKAAVDFYGANLVIFNDELSGAQLRNLEERLETKIIDRTALILDIFALRAQSKVSKLQVEMAQHKYRMSRLVGLGQSLSRTGGGIGTRGPGEQKLEIDRRRINTRLSDIRAQLKEASKDRATQRSQRKKNQIPTVALVGYTNAGKSTLMNKFIERFDQDQDKKVFTKDMLFATLDTSTRKIEVDKNIQFLLTDTVGFVSKLPHALVEAFKATLEEVLEADLLLHIVDATNVNLDMQMKVTHEVLEELGAKEKKELVLFNKVDLLEEPAYHPLAHFEVSAATGMGLDKVLDRIEEELFQDLKKIVFHIPYDQGAIQADIVAHSEVEQIDYEADYAKVICRTDQITRNKYKEYIDHYA